MKAIERTTIDRIVDLHSQIESALKKSLDQAIELGGLLAEVKQDLPHGQFTTWIKENLPFTDRTARRYMKIHESRDRLGAASGISEAYKALEDPKTDTVSDLVEFDEVDQALSRLSDLCWHKVKVRELDGIFIWPLDSGDWDYVHYLREAKKRSLTPIEKRIIEREMTHDKKAENAQDFRPPATFFTRIAWFCLSQHSEYKTPEYVKETAEKYIQFCDDAQKAHEFARWDQASLLDFIEEDLKALHTIRDYFTA